MGLEPTRYCYHRHLKPARLPIPPLLHLLLSLRSQAQDIYYMILQEMSTVIFKVFKKINAIYFFDKLLLLIHSFRLFCVSGKGQNLLRNKNSKYSYHNKEMTNT